MTLLMLGTIIDVSPYRHTLAVNICRVRYTSYFKTLDSFGQQLKHGQDRARQSGKSASIFN